MIEVTKGDRIRLHFSLALKNGQSDTVIDSTFDNENAAELTLGDGTLPEGFENCLKGMKAGEDKTFTLLPEEAFGQPNPANIHVMPLEKFKNFQLEEGLMISFADPGKQQRPGVVRHLGEKTVTIDFNHPLAGRTLNFRTHILEILPANKS